MAHFAKRHYETVATAVQNAMRYCETDNQRRGVERLRNELIAAFIADNPQFDRLRFEHACKAGSNVKARTAHLSA